MKLISRDSSKGYGVMSPVAHVTTDDDSGADQIESQNQFLSFRLADEVYAIDLMSLREIIGYGDLTSVPMMPGFIRGVINLRGRVVPVVDLAERLGGQKTEVRKRTSIIIVEIFDESDNERIDIGIIVDSVNEVLDICPDDIEPPPSFGAKIRTDFIEGMGKVDGKFLVLLDIGNILSIEELSMLNDVNVGVKEPARKPETE